MRRRTHSFLLILIVICLPLQAVAAGVMSACRYAHQAVVEVPVGIAPAVMDHTVASCHEAVVATSAAPDGHGCDNCENCQLASSSCLLAGEDITLPLMLSVFVERRATANRSFIATPPEQPPRR